VNSCYRFVCVWPQTQGGILKLNLHKCKQSEYITLHKNLCTLLPLLRRVTIPEFTKQNFTMRIAISNRRNDNIESYVQKQPKKWQPVAYFLHVGFLLSLLFDPEDGSGIFFRNVDWLSPDYTVLYSRRYNSSDRRLGGCQSRSGTDEEEIFCLCLESNSGRPDYSLATTVTQLFPAPAL
jgi:hypothetical protein